MEIRQNLVFDVSTKYRRRIDVNSTWSARWENKIKLKVKKNKQKIFLMKLPKISRIF